VILSLTQLYRYTPEIFLWSKSWVKLYPFQWLTFSLSHVRWLFLSYSSEGGPVGIFKCGSRKEKYLGSVTI
jgi:hypothetical protein